MERSWTTVFRAKRNVANILLYAGNPVSTTPDWRRGVRGMMTSRVVGGEGRGGGWGVRSGLYPSSRVRNVKVLGIRCSEHWEREDKNNKNDMLRRITRFSIQPHLSPCQAVLQKKIENWVIICLVQICDVLAAGSASTCTTTSSSPTRRPKTHSSSIHVYRGRVPSNRIFF